MSRRIDVAVSCILAAGLSSGPGCSSVKPQAFEAGHHRLLWVTPAGWEHLDHGRQQLFRHGDCQMSLVDLGIATQAGLVQDLQRAEALWHSGHPKDAVARVHEIRGPMFQDTPPNQVADFWKPWFDVVSRPDPVDSAAIEAAFPALIEGARKLPPVTDDRLLEYVLSASMHNRSGEIVRQSRRAIHGSDWVDVETWDRVSHLDRSRFAWTENGGYLLVLGVDRGPFEQAEAAFEALLTSIEVRPAEPQTP